MIVTCGSIIVLGFAAAGSSGSNNSSSSSINSSSSSNTIAVVIVAVTVEVVKRIARNSTRSTSHWSVIFSQRAAIACGEVFESATHIHTHTHT